MAAILQLQLMVHVTLFPMLTVLYFYVSVSRSVCEVSSVAVFCSSWMSCFPRVLIRFIIIIIIIIIMCIGILSKYPSHHDLPLYSQAAPRPFQRLFLFIRIANYELISSIGVLKSGCGIFLSIYYTACSITME